MESTNSAASLKPIKLRAKYVLPAAHGFLFLAMWGFYAASHQALSVGVQGLLFAILVVADFPLSYVAFGYMFMGGRDGTIAVIAWGVGGTLEWYLLGLAFDNVVGRFRRKGA